MMREVNNPNMNFILSILKDLSQRYSKISTLNMKSISYIDLHSFLTINNTLYDMWLSTLKRYFSALSPWYQIVTSHCDYKEALLNICKIKPEVLNSNLEEDDLDNLLCKITLKEFIYNKTIHHQGKLIFEISNNEEKIMEYYELLKNTMIKMKKEGVFCNKNLDRLVGKRVATLPNTCQCFFQNLISIIAEILRRAYNNEISEEYVHEFIKEETYESCTLKIFKLGYNHSQTTIIEYYITAAALCCMLFDPITAQFFIDLTIPHITSYFEPKLENISLKRLKRSFLSISRSGDAFLLSHLLTGFEDYSEVIGDEKDNIFEVIRQLHETKPNFIGMFNGDVQYFGVFGNEVIWSQQYADVIYVPLFDYQQFMSASLFDNEKNVYIGANQLSHNDYHFFSKNKFCYDTLMKSLNEAEIPLFDQRMSFYFSSDSLPEKLAAFTDCFIPINLLTDGKLISTIRTVCGEETYAKYLSLMKYTPIKMHK